MKITIDDGMGAKPNRNKQQLAAQGQNGDTQLAHVNPFEQMLLKALGGAGTRNPRTGLKQFYIDPTTGLKVPEVMDGGGTELAGNGQDFFNIPLDIKPFSVSQSTGGGSTSSSQSSSSRSGLPENFQTQLLTALMPQLTSSITNMPGNIDQYTNEALGSYNQMMSNAVKQNLPAAIRGLANRGILNSTEGQAIMGKVLSDAAIDASTKGYTTAMQAALMKAGMPQVLAGIGQLGQSSTATSQGQSAGTTTNNSYSYSEDPTVMYRQMAQMIQAML